MTTAAEGKIDGWTMEIDNNVLVHKFCHMYWKTHVFDSSPPSTAYMRRFTEYALVQVMVFRLFGAKPLA